MTITRKLTSMTTAVALAATALAPMTTAASAEGWHDGGDRSYARSERRDGDRHDDGGHYRYAHRRHHDNTGKYIALGVGALMLGIIASEAGRR
jgi:Ni/Co efflux regulator RcnB